MTFDPKVFRANSAYSIGSPADDPATDSVSAWTQISLLKGILAKLSGAIGLPAGAATAANQLDTVDALATLHADAASLLPQATAAVTSVPSGTSSVQALAANSSRKMATFFNTDANAALLKLGTTASSSSFTVKIASGGYYELPKPIYTGRIDVIWEADGAGSLLVTEY